MKIYKLKKEKSFFSLMFKQMSKLSNDKWESKQNKSAKFHTLQFSLSDRWERCSNFKRTCGARLQPVTTTPARVSLPS